MIGRLNTEGIRFAIFRSLYLLLYLVVLSSCPHQWFDASFHEITEKRDLDRKSLAQLHARLGRINTIDTTRLQAYSIVLNQQIHTFPSKS